MPTPIVGSQKTAFLALVNTAPYPGGPFGVMVLNTFLTNYSDLVRAIAEQIDLFASNNAYLTEAMAIFAANDTDLQAAGIYVSKTLTSQNDGFAFINSTISSALTISANNPGVAILNSTVKRINVSTTIQLQNLYIGPGSSVDVFDSSASGSFVNNIWLPFAKNNPASLNSVVQGSGIGAVRVDDGSYYGGMDNIDPQLSCGNAVTALAATNITHNAITLTWTPAVSGYTFINVYYKKSESAVWLLVDDDAGSYQNTAGVYVGFDFIALEADTYYDFKVSARCNNGGVASTTVSGKTVCCS